jgi:hypothetical protein
MNLRNLNIGMVTLLIGLCTGCSTYIDTVERNSPVPTVRGFMTSYPDSNVFVYKTNVILTRDTERITPRSFKLNLPKRLKHYEVVGSTDFVFYYDKHQALMLRILLENDGKSPLKRSEEVPTKGEVEHMIDSKLTFGRARYDIKDLSYLTNRKHLMVKDKGVTFLLYNIDPGQYTLFVQCLNSFKWL